MERCAEMLERPVSEAMFPAHLRKIGEHRIAEYLEDLMSEVDTHEAMFLELCEAKRKLTEPVRHGRWIPNKVGAVETKFECSECGRTVILCNDYFAKATKHASHSFPYCHCGCKMDAEEDV